MMLSTPAGIDNFKFEHPYKVRGALENTVHSLPAIQARRIAVLSEETGRTNGQG